MNKQKTIIILGIIFLAISVSTVAGDIIFRCPDEVAEDIYASRIQTEPIEIYNINEELFYTESNITGVDNMPFINPDKAIYIGELEFVTLTMDSICVVPLGPISILED